MIYFYSSGSSLGSVNSSNMEDPEVTEATSLKESFSSVRVPVLSKQMVLIIPQMLIFSGIMQ